MKGNCHIVPVHCSVKMGDINQTLRTSKTIAIWSSVQCGFPIVLQVDLFSVRIGCCYPSLCSYWPQDSHKCYEKAHKGPDSRCCHCGTQLPFPVTVLTNRTSRHAARSALVLSSLYSVPDPGSRVLVSLCAGVFAAESSVMNSALLGGGLNRGAGEIPRRDLGIILRVE